MLTIHITSTDGQRGTPTDKLADAEIHFTAGALHGLKLIGFSIWRRRGGQGYNVTFPARQYTVNGERRAFALLRPTGQRTSPDEPLKAAIIAAYEEHIGIAKTVEETIRPEAFPMLPQADAAPVPAAQVGLFAELARDGYTITHPAPAPTENAPTVPALITPGTDYL